MTESFEANTTYLYSSLNVENSPTGEEEERSLFSKLLQNYNKNQINHS
jgi:hypothetical protein